jgi:hypothetical protein
MRNKWLILLLTCLVFSYWNLRSQTTKTVCSIENLEKGYVIAKTENCCCGSASNVLYTIIRIDSLKNAQVSSLVNLPTGWVVYSARNGDSNAPDGYKNVYVIMRIDSLKSAQVSSLVNLPTGWVVYNARNGDSNAPDGFRNVYVIQQTDSLKTTKVCSIESLPSGWVVMNIENGDSNSPDGYKIDYTIKKIDKMPKGSSLTICSLKNIPADWEILAKEQCDCCGASSGQIKNQWKIRKK